VKNPSYEQVCTGRTGGAELIQIELDSKNYTTMNQASLLEIIVAPGFKSAM
jgi:peptide methionine sulfoxide reductase MsrA